MCTEYHWSHAAGESVEINGMTMVSVDEIGQLMHLTSLGQAGVDGAHPVAKAGVSTLRAQRILS